MSAVKAKSTSARKFIPKNRSKETFSKPVAGQFSQRERILIVCEDSVHSVEYFKKVAGREGLNLSAVDIDITGDCGSAPKSVYEYTKRKIDKDITDNGEDNAFDIAYCVFDKDGHADFSSTLETIRQNPKYKNIEVKAIPCIISFEIWILLHFSDSTKSFKKAQDVINAIKVLDKSDRALTDFDKDTPAKIYISHLKPRQANAIKHSKRVLKNAIEIENDNPSTLIHEVIEKMEKEAKKK